MIGPKIFDDLPAVQRCAALEVWRRWPLIEGGVHVWHGIAMFLASGRAAVIVAEDGAMCELVGAEAWLADREPSWQEAQMRADLATFRGWREEALRRVAGLAGTAEPSAVPVFAGVLYSRQRKTALDVLEGWPAGGPVGLWHGIVIFMARDRAPRLVSKDGALAEILPYANDLPAFMTSAEERRVARAFDRMMREHS